MDWEAMDTYYRAYRCYLNALEDTKESRVIRDSFMRSETGCERQNSVYYDVTIADDWIERIERAIPHLEAAVREDRQFIKTEGTITSIERVRKVSRGSVEHLARHTEMITHTPDEGENLIPDKLQVYENESKYDVYENRVLYLVLCSARDFMNMRYCRIADAWKEKSMESECAEYARTSSGRISFELKISDTTGGPESEELSRKIARIEAALGAISGLLNMPLMMEVALSPMVTPPITRTNVLRMDRHFREVVALYDFLSAYAEDGYTLNRHESEKTPFPEEMRQMMTELAMLALHMNQMYGKDLAEELQTRYEEQERLRHEEELRAAEERLQELRDRWNKGQPIQESEWLSVIDGVTEEHIQELEKLNGEIADVRAELARKESAGDREEALFKQMQNLREYHNKCTDLASKSISKNAETIQLLVKANEELTHRIAEEKDKVLAMKARVTAMKELCNPGRGEEDCSEREEFLELEREKEAFERVYNRNWKKAKKKIRRRILWRKD